MHAAYGSSASSSFSSSPAAGWGGGGGGGGGGSGGGASGLSERVKGKELQFSSQNTTILKTSVYAFVVNIDALFSTENRFVLASGGSYPVFGRSGVIMIPSAVVKLSSALPNTMYPETRPYLDKLLPMTAVWVGESKVCKILDWIYEDENVKANMEKFTKSLECHKDELFPGDVPPIDVPTEIKARIIETDLEAAEHEGVHHKTEEKDMDNDDKTGPWYAKFQNCCLVMPMCGIKLMRMVSKNHMFLNYSHFVPADGKSETFLGGDHNPVLGVFSMAEKFNVNAADLQAILHHKKIMYYVVKCSPAIIAEYRKLLRMCYRVGSGVSGDRHRAFADRCCYQNDDFERRTLVAITQSKLEDGHETMAHLAASMVYKTMNFSFAVQDYKYILDCEKEVAWTFLVGSMLGPYTAPNVAWLSSTDTGKRSKLKFGMISKSCLNNLQSTSSKWSRGVCGLTLYLMRRLQMNISPAKANMVFAARSIACTRCEGDCCALVWSNAYTDNIHISDAVKNRTAATQMLVSYGPFQPELQTNQV
ncbi:hypothetical protein EGW08_023669 [Elysia chlorotica]|uniref:Uncharacterized protein n=1 Tax=Elysia chlorotica TaxID=188477 RepID=A0A3S1AUF3_ELYCH|nr:hypothetical protein EGW08_023669 [Elysia chlorotica]